MSMSHDYEPDFEDDIPDAPEFDDADAREAFDPLAVDEDDRGSDAESDEDLDDEPEEEEEPPVEQAAEQPSPQDDEPETGAEEEPKPEPAARQPSQAPAREATSLAEGHPDESPEQIRARVDDMAERSTTGLGQGPIARRVREAMPGGGSAMNEAAMASIVAAAVAAALEAHDAKAAQAQAKPARPAVEPKSGAPDTKAIERASRKLVERQQGVLPSIKDRAEQQAPEQQPEQVVEPEPEPEFEESPEPFEAPAPAPEPPAAAAPQAPEPVEPAEPVAQPRQQALPPAPRRAPVPARDELDEDGEPFVRKVLADSDLAKVDRFPKELLVHLRARLAAAVGEAPGSGFTAEAKGRQGLSNTTLLVGFVCSVLGDEYELDEQTQRVADAFSASDPRLDQIDRKMTEVVSRMQSIERDARLAAAHSRAAGDESYAANLGVAFLVGDRAVGFPSLTRGQAPDTVDVSHPDVVTTRDAIRRRANAQRSTERSAEGRTIRRSTT